jgi:hypothetical protein
LFYRHSNQIFDLLVEIYMELSKLLSFMNNSTMGSPSVRLLAYFCQFFFLLLYLSLWLSECSNLDHILVPLPMHLVRSSI